MRSVSNVWMAGWLAAGALACGSQSEPVALEAGGVSLEVTVDPAAPRVGDNAIWLELRRAGEPWTGASVAVEVRMPAMGAMPAMGGSASVREIGAGRYRADFKLDMTGSWDVSIEARAAGQAPVRAEGSLAIGTPGLRLAVVGGAAQAAESAHAGHAATAEATHPGEFQMDPGRLQQVGVKLAHAERRVVDEGVRAVGRVVPEATGLVDVSLKVRGWAREVQVGAVGDPVEAGQILLTVYSPELYAAQQEYLQALKSQARDRATATPDRSDYLVRAARTRLRLWDVSDAELSRIAQAGEPLEQLPIRAPTGGFVLEKSVVEGGSFEPGQTLYRIAPLARVWIEAEIYEFELGLVAKGQRASVELPYVPGRRLEAVVGYVYPTLDPATRTARVRLELDNPDLLLRPDMYANVRIETGSDERLVVPLSAVLHAGEKSFVFRALEPGRFRPQAVVVGRRSGEEVEILSGLEAGDAVVASGTFLIASESRLRAALEQW